MCILNTRTNELTLLQKQHGELNAEFNVSGFETSKANSL